MNCIRVHRSDEGFYTIPGESEIEDWGEVQAGDYSGDVEVVFFDNLKGWGWERVYQISTPIGGGWSDQWYFVKEERTEDSHPPTAAAAMHQYVRSLAPHLPTAE